jgi:hypothetical protein
VSRRHAAVGPVIGLLLAGALTGCGIRATSVPVDAGPAPSRVSCAMPDTGPSTDAFGMMTVRVYLLCSGQLSPVQRSVRERALDRLAAARLLLGELEKQPTRAEGRSGFSSPLANASTMSDDLTVVGPSPGDPPETLRLNQDPVFLPSYTVGQLVCTFSGTPAGAQGGSVVLGGPDPRMPARRYTCDGALTISPDAGPTAGRAVG